MAFQDITNLDKAGNNAPYETFPERWYKSYPYGFAFWDSKQSGGLAKQTFWLPIAPNNINIVTHFATNVVATLYGIVEEHSEVRFYDITISGNTGIAPRYTTPFTATSVDGTSTPQPMPGVSLPNSNPGSGSTGRKSFEPGLSSKLSSALGGFLPEVTNTIAAAADLVTQIGGGNPNPTGISPQQSGYYAFHNFYKFLLRYKMDAASIAKTTALPVPSVGSLTGDNLRTNYPLQFLNYKDAIKYDVIPLSFTMTRSAENPMLYNYTIKMRAFNLRNVNAQPVAENLLAQLGLGGLEGNLFSKMTSVAGNASTLISGISGTL